MLDQNPLKSISFGKDFDLRRVTKSQGSRKDEANNSKSAGLEHAMLATAEGHGSAGTAGAVMATAPNSWRSGLYLYVALISPQVVFRAGTGGGQ